VAETAVKFLEDWRESRIYAEARALDELDEIVRQCIADAAQAGFPADALEKAAGGSLKEYLREAIIETSE
jgi:hypothetical protein